MCGGVRFLIYIYEKYIYIWKWGIIELSSHSPFQLPLSCVLIHLWLVIPAVSWLLLVMQLFGFETSQNLLVIGGHMPPISLAILIDESHLGLREQLDKIMVLRAEGAWQASSHSCCRGDGGFWLEEHSMDSLTAQYMQLHFGYGVLEVVLCGCAGIQTPIWELQGPQQQPLICPQYPSFSAELWKEKQQKK